jgi:hypothetical protein
MQLFISRTTRPHNTLGDYAFCSRSVQLEKVRNDGGNNTDTWLNHLGSLVSTTPYLLMALGASSRLNVCIETGYTARNPALCNTYVIFSMATATIWMFVHLTIVLRHHWLELVSVDKAVQLSCQMGYGSVYHLGRCTDESNHLCL